MLRVYRPDIPVGSADVTLISLLLAFSTAVAIHTASQLLKTLTDAGHIDSFLLWLPFY